MKKHEEEKKANTNTRDCEHGQLARACQICDKDAEIAELRAEVQRLRALLVVYGDVAGQNAEWGNPAWLNPAPGPKPIGGCT
jgi:hypothetical protein